jgi:hypothetical protein
LLARFYGYLKENWILTVLLPLVGVVLGLTLYLVTPYKIQSTMMVVSEVLTETECDYLMRQLELTDSLNPLSTGQFKEKVKLRHSIKRDTWSKAAYIEMTIRVRDGSLLEPVQNTILTFLEASETARRKVADSKEYHMQMMVEIDRELKSIEEVKNQFDNKTKATFLNPSDLFRTSVDLQEKKVNLQIKLKDIRAFRPVQGSMAMSKKIKLPAPLMAAIGFIGGCVVLLMVLFVKFFLGYYREYNQSVNA